MKQLVMERIARLCIKQGVSQIGFGCPWKSGISKTINIFTTNTTKLFFFLKSTMKTPLQCGKYVQVSIKTHSDDDSDVILAFYSLTQNRSHTLL